MIRGKKHRRTAALEISPKTRQVVEERDNGLCIFCGKPGRGEAHFISRAQGGLGIPQNILTVCRVHHDMMDNSTERETMLKIAEAHLRECYPKWSKEDLIYNKWRDL